MQKEDKYKELNSSIKKIFAESKERFGYRRIHSVLKNQGIIVSEKVIRRIMKATGLTVKIRKTRKYSSYLGEISPAVENLVNRDFHAVRPNQKWLTDITEFSIKAGKVYVNDKFVSKAMFESKVDLSNALIVGKNKIEIEYSISYRNLFGPLHNNREDYGVGPWAFEWFGTWDKGVSPQINSEYTFARNNISK